MESGAVITREPWPDADQGCLRADGSAQEEMRYRSAGGRVKHIIHIYIYIYIYMCAVEYQSIYTMG